MVGFRCFDAVVFNDCGVMFGVQLFTWEFLTLLFVFSGLGVLRVASWEFLVCVGFSGYLRVVWVALFCGLRCGGLGW